MKMGISLGEKTDKRKTTILWMMGVEVKIPEQKWLFLKPSCCRSRPPSFDFQSMYKNHEWCGNEGVRGCGWKGYYLARIICLTEKIVPVFHLNRLKE
jgi:hypothetical protein